MPETIDTIACPVEPSERARLASAYFAAVRRVALRRSVLPLDHSTPPVGLRCIAPPAMTEGT